MSDRKSYTTEPEQKNADKFVEGVDFYFSDGLMILTERFLLRRGYCCGNGCRHCPYPKSENVESQKKSV